MGYHISDSEYRFMEILWEEEPVSSMELVRLCSNLLNWKKSTTYTVIRNLSEKQIVYSENAIVRTRVSRGCIQRQESSCFLNRKFGGSLPSFIAAYLQDRKLTREEAERLQKLIWDAAEDK